MLLHKQVFKFRIIFPCAIFNGMPRWYQHDTLKHTENTLGLYLQLYTLYDLQKSYTDMALSQKLNRVLNEQGPCILYSYTHTRSHYFTTCTYTLDIYTQNLYGLY